MCLNYITIRFFGRLFLNSGFLSIYTEGIVTFSFPPPFLLINLPLLEWHICREERVILQWLAPQMAEPI